MNKKNMMIIAGLALSVATAMPTIMYRQDAIAYLCDLKTLNKNITEDSFVQDGYEDLIECLQTDIAVIESKLQKISVAKSLAKAAAAVAGIGTLKFTCLNLPHYIIDKLDTYNRDFYSTPVFTRQLGLFKEIAIGACTVAVTYVALSLYDTFKTRNELQKSLALDKEFLAQLIGFKEFAEKPLI